MEHVVVFGDQEYLDGEVPKDLDPDVADWSGVRAWRNLETDDPEWLGFECEFGDGDKRDDWGRHLWIYAEENAWRSRRSTVPTRSSLTTRCSWSSTSQTRTANRYYP
jgi:hypothetical protein